MKMKVIYGFRGEFKRHYPLKFNELNNRVESTFRPKKSYTVKIREKLLFFIQEKSPRFVILYFVLLLLAL